MTSARLADELGYRRLWFAEHHNAPNLAASAKSLLIAQAASVTEKIRVGSGGVMLPNHAPLMVAEQYGTIANIVARQDSWQGRYVGLEGESEHGKTTSDSGGEEDPDRVERDRWRDEHR